LEVNVRVRDFGFLLKAVIEGEQFGEDFAELAFEAGDLIHNYARPLLTARQAKALIKWQIMRLDGTFDSTEVQECAIMFRTVELIEEGGKR
jgi:hypothetical protein